LIVDHVKIPEFVFARSKDDDNSGNDDVLKFEVKSLKFGPKGDEDDECLRVSLRVVRDAGYYDNNIIPLLALLNVVGICTLTLDSLEFGSRAEIILAVAFVAMGLRLTVDSKLPQVGYQIKLQKILNRFFYTLLAMHIESSLVYTLTKRYKVRRELTHGINVGTMVTCALYTLVQLYEYYRDRHETTMTSTRSSQGNW